MFADALELKLKLTVDGKDFKVPGGNVKSFKVDLHQYGFACRAGFVVSSETEKDKLLSAFTQQTLMEAELQISPHFKQEDAQIDPLTVKGIVTNKAILAEQTIEETSIKGDLIIYRHYQVDFADPAQVLWRQHFPCDLKVDKTMKDVLDAHKGSKISLTYDWDVLDKKHSIIALPLGVEANEAGFYDFVLWYVHTRNGVWTYNATDNSYSITKSKSQDGEASALDRRDIDRYEIRFPETIRYNVNLLNAYSESPQTQAVSQDKAVQGVRRDYIGRFPITSDFQDRQTLETARLKARDHEIHLSFRGLPRKTFLVGKFIKLEGNLWSDKIFSKGKIYRVRSIAIEASSVNAEPTADHNMDFAAYNIEMQSQLETKGESVVRLPPFRSPRFPMHVEGKVVSEQGADDEVTYQIYQDANTSQDQYKVKIPLWENQQVVMAFEPNFFPGHFYFPAYKNARVLAALDLHSARIERFLDWKSGTRLPADTQGNQLLLGKKAKSQTSLKHTYVDNKPELNIMRTSDSDTEMIKMGEGTLILQTKEESDS
jgi:hypothetical protein